MNLDQEFRDGDRRALLIVTVMLLLESNPELDYDLLERQCTEVVGKRGMALGLASDELRAVYETARALL